MRLTYYLLTTILSGYLFCFNAVADNVSEKQKELKALQAKINVITKQINDLKGQKQHLMEDLRMLETQYAESSSTLKTLNEQITKLNAALHKTHQQIKAKQRIISGQKQALAVQIRAAYGTGRHEKLKLLLNQKDPLISGRMLTYYDYFNQSRLQIITRINKDIQSLHDLEATRFQQADQVQAKITLQKQQHALLSTTKEQRKTLLEKINTQYASNQKQLNRFKADEKRLQSLLASLQQIMDDFPLDEGSVKPFAQLRGQLPWPVKGKISKKFGTQRADSRWDGVLIEATEGNEVRAVTRGRIAYADWLRGYGLLTIIDHGQGYMTLYAFNQSLYKTMGDWVEAGTVIATVGQSGGQSTSGLYFGIRKKGKPVNPVKWCRTVRRGRVG